MSEIAAAAKQQAIALQAVSTSVNQMERMTQQNAAMVQETAVAGNDLASQTEDLVAMVGHFRTRQVTAEEGLIERRADANSSARVERDATRRTPLNAVSRRVRRALGRRPCIGRRLTAYSVPIRPHLRTGARRVQAIVMWAVSFPSNRVVFQLQGRRTGAARPAIKSTSFHAATNARRVRR